MSTDINLQSIISGIKQSFDESKEQNVDTSNTEISTDTNLQSVISEFKQTLNKNTEQYISALEEIIVRLIKKDRNSSQRAVHRGSSYDRIIGQANKVISELDKHTSSYIDAKCLEYMLSKLNTGYLSYSLHISCGDIVLRIRA